VVSRWMYTSVWATCWPDARVYRHVCIEYCYTCTITKTSPLLSTCHHVPSYLYECVSFARVYAGSFFIFAERLLCSSSYSRVISIQTFFICFTSPLFVYMYDSDFSHLTTSLSCLEIFLVMLMSWRGKPNERTTKRWWISIKL